MPFRFSPGSAWSLFALRARRYSWIREVSVRAPREAGPEGGEASAPAPHPGGTAASGAAAGPDRRRDAADAAAAMQQVESMLSFWRDMPPVPGEAELAAAGLPRPFQYDELPPAPPSAEEGRAELERRVRAAIGGGPPSLSPMLLAVAGSGLGAASAAALALRGTGSVPAALGALCAGGSATAVAGAWLRARRREAEARLVARRIAAEWPAFQERASAAWRFERAEWELRRAQARVAWAAGERDRLERVRRIRAGDAASARACLEATLADLDFPFRATCEVALDGDVAHLLVDLPDPADVVPALRVRVDADLQVEEVAVPDAEREEAYTELAAGVALLLGRTAFAAAPALRRALVAAWRPSAAAGGAEYLLDVEADRAAVQAFDPATVDPDAYLAILPGRFLQREDHRLSALTPPAWVSLAFGPLALAPPPAAWRN
jgi:hypothetical protein